MRKWRENCCLSNFADGFWNRSHDAVKPNRGPGGRDDKGKSPFPPTHCAEAGVVGSIPTHVPWVYLRDLSCAVKFPVAILYGVVICNFDEDL